MRKLIFTFSVLFLCYSLLAQDKGKKNEKWKHEGLLSIALGQGGSRNWAPGAERFSFQGTARVFWLSQFKDGRHSWDSYADLAYGMQNSNTTGVRKTMDKIDVLSKYNYSISKKVSLAGWFNMRTQFSNGFDYNEAPKRRISGIMAPGYITVAPGFDWKPCKSGDLSIFFSPAYARIIATTNRPYSYNYQGGLKPDGSTERSLADKYGVDPERKVDGEVGFMTSIAWAKKDIVKNVDFRSRLDAFGDYIDNEPWNMDIFLNSMFTMKVNNWLNVTYSFDMIYDNDQKQFGPLRNKAAAQLHSMLGVGLGVKL